MSEWESGEWSVECRQWSVESGVRSVQCAVRSVECVWSVEPAGFCHGRAGNQVAESIRASGKESTPLEALRANAAHTQGMLS